jgi:hypothetical protein
MSIPEHRRAAGRAVDPRWWLVATFLLGVLVAAGGAAVIAVASDGSDGSGSAGPVAGRSGETPGAGGGSGTAGSAPSTPPAAAERRALATLPLAQLQPGDRVVYNMGVCRFRTWVEGGLDVALIACPDEAPFQAKTAYLVPVEAARGD